MRVVEEGRSHQIAKSRLRGVMAEVVSAIPLRTRLDADEAICARLVRLCCTRPGVSVGGYLGLRDEPRIDSLMCRILERHGAILLPRVSRTELEFDPWWPTCRLERDESKVLAPRKGDSATSVTPDVVLVPGRSFDATGRRLGRGGGFYDRFLGRWGTRVLSVGIAYEKQVVEAVPSDRFDQRVAVVVTEERVRVRGAGPIGFLDADAIESDSDYIDDQGH